MRACSRSVTLSGPSQRSLPTWAEVPCSYLLFNDDHGEPMLVAALEAYEPALGVRLDRGRIRLCNAACAIGFLAHRAGTPPEARPCGRTLAEDLAWVKGALRSLEEA